MKKLSIVIFTAVSLLLFSCIFGPKEDDFPGDPFQNSQYEPIVMARSVFENTTQLLPPRNIINSGKIYIKDQFLFINEVHEGYHVFNNSNPETPENIGFIKVLVSTDLAIKNNILYSNNGPDLIAIIPDFETTTVEITKRIPNTFPDSMSISPDGFYFEPGANEIIIGYRLIE